MKVQRRKDIYISWRKQDEAAGVDRQVFATAHCLQSRSDTENLDRRWKIHSGTKRKSTVQKMSTCSRQKYSIRLFVFQSVQIGIFLMRINLREKKMGVFVRTLGFAVFVASFKVYKRSQVQAWYVYGVHDCYIDVNTKFRRNFVSQMCIHRSTL
jgi:hypothetical protein